MKLDYYLTERNSDVELESPYYGAIITKHLDDLVESSEIKGISTSKDIVVSIIKKLCQFEVTPISMVEIVDELVTEGI
jgi:hypothetical protein